MVRDPSSDVTHGISTYKAVNSWESCDQCKNGNQYKSYAKGKQHVEEKHFGSTGLHNRVLAHWLRDAEQYRMDQRLELYLKYLKIAGDHLQAIYDGTYPLRDGAVSNNDESTARFRLPSALIKSFEHVIMLMMHTALALQLADGFCKRMEENTADQRTAAESRSKLEVVRDDLDTSGFSAILLLEKAEQDLLLMAHTEADRSVIIYDVVGPEFVLSTIMANLFSRPLANDQTVEDIYGAYYDKLVRP
jgi:hypothetical protein